MQAHSYLKLSVVVALATITLKTLAWWVTGSVGLLSDAMESFVNLAAALFALWMVMVAARPPDADHPFGHAKAEYFSSGLEGLLIFVASIAIIWSAVPRLLHPQPLEQLGVGTVLSLLSSALNGLLAVMMRRAAVRLRSIALEADARHLMTDVYTSVGVVAGVLLVPVTGWLWLDPVLAIGVALNISREGASLLRRSADGLMDHALDAEQQQAIETVLQSYRRQRADEAGLRVDDVKTRRGAQLRYCELHLHVPAAWSVGQAMREREALARALIASVPGLRVTIELVPLDMEPVADESDMEGKG
jgi:cation diffusion facilitator family transporter